MPISHRFCVAPMLDWTDRHCRSFHRLLSRRARLYSEMLTTGAILHGNRQQLLGFDPAEHPVALQLGGSDPRELAKAARIGEAFGYDEINLNLGCPSDRVQAGRFGACLMLEPRLVAEAIRAMRDAVQIEVTVKHRIGVDAVDSEEALLDFVGTLAEAGCRTFIVHARKAWLKGLSPKENREIPPLDPGRVRRLKASFPELNIVINGGILTLDEAKQHLSTLAACRTWSVESEHRPQRAQFLPDLQPNSPAIGQKYGEKWAAAVDVQPTTSKSDRLLDGVMLGRAAYHNPWLLAEVDAKLFGERNPVQQRHEVMAALLPYIKNHLTTGGCLHHISRHILGLYQGQPGARAWRRALGASGLGLTELLKAQEAIERL